MSTLLVNNKGIILTNSLGFDQFIDHIEIYANGDGFIQIIVIYL